MDLRDASLGFYRVWLSAVGAEAGLLAPLRAPATPRALAARLGLAPEAVARWCEAAHGAGLLARDPRGRYLVPAPLRPRLCEPHDARDLTRHFRYLAHKSADFAQLHAHLRGEPPSRRPAAATYAVATEWDHLAFFELSLPRDPEARAALESGDVLDLGCGLGGWARTCKARHPGARVTAYDPDASGYPRGAAARGVRWLRAPPSEASFDLVHLGEVLAATPHPRAVLADAYRALRPGGLLRVVEGLLPPEGADPRGWGDRLPMAMAFDFALDGSRFLRTPEAMSLLREAGFVGTGRRHLGGGLHVLRGRRPKG